MCTNHQKDNADKHGSDCCRTIRWPRQRCFSQSLRLGRASRRVGLTAQQKVEAKGKEKRVRTAQDHTVASLAVVSTTIALGVSDGSMHMLLAPQQSPIFCTCTVLKCFGTDLGGGR